MIKKSIFACALVACTLLFSCSKTEGDYADLFVGRYKVEIKSQVVDGAVDVSNSQPFSYTMKIDKAGDSLIVALDSVTKAMGYADAEGLHVESLTFKQRYPVASAAESGVHTFNCTLSLRQFTMPIPLSNGTNQLSVFRATTTGSGTIDHSVTPDLTLNNVIGTSIVRATMVNDPNYLVDRDTNSWPPVIF